MKIKSMTDAQLAKLSEKIIKEIENRAAKEDAMASINSMIEKSGFTLDDLIGGRAKGVKGFKVAPKFKHKEDSSLTWSGRGRMPKWIKKFGVKV